MHLFTTLTALTLVAPTFAGPALYGVCQAGCSAVVMACYAAAGAVWGATAGLGAPPAIIACNTAFGICQASCAAAVLAPTPQSYIGGWDGYHRCAMLSVQVDGVIGVG